MRQVPMMWLTPPRWKDVARLRQRLGFVRNRFPGRRRLLLLLEVSAVLQQQAQPYEWPPDDATREEFVQLAMELEDLYDRLEPCRDALLSPSNGNLGGGRQRR